MKYRQLKFKIPIPENSNIYAEVNDKTYDLLLYEVDQLEVLEEVAVEKAKVNFHVKDGQFINKGDIIFTEGILGHKAMVSDVAGIIEIKEDKCKILGQKKHYERRINIDGYVSKLVPKKFIQIICNVTSIYPHLYLSEKTKLTGFKYFENKKDLNNETVKLHDLEMTFFINDNLYIDDIARIIALGVRRLVVNGLYITDLNAFKRELMKLEGFAVLAGFGEFIAKRFTFTSPKKDIIWSRKGIHISDEIKVNNLRVFEHPFWGISGDFKKKSDVIGELDYNREVFEFYLKNLEIND